jgi:hypothetical protein
LLATDWPASDATHSFWYVLPSHAQTCFVTVGQSVGLALQKPAPRDVMHEPSAIEQNSSPPQSEDVVHVPWQLGIEVAAMRPPNATKRSAPKLWSRLAITALLYHTRRFA